MTLSVFRFAFEIKYKYMESSTSISQMIGGNNFKTSSYNWNTSENLNDKTGDVNKFIHCLNDYIQAIDKQPYYFGHFVFSEGGLNKFEVIDGNQRLTTIQLLLTVVFRRLIIIRPMKNNEFWIYQDIISFKYKKYRFTFYEEEDKFIKSKIFNKLDNTEVYVLDDSIKKIEKAYYFMTDFYSDKDENYLVKTLHAIASGTCRNYIIKDNLHISIFTTLNDKSIKL